MAEKAGVNSLKRKFATDAEEKRQLLTERRKTSQTASRPLVDGEDSLPGLRSIFKYTTVERDERFDVATETTGKLKAAEASIAL